MSEFTKKLAIEISNDGQRAVVTAGFTYELHHKGSGDVVLIRVGFGYDGLSLPRYLRVFHVFAPKWGYGKAVLVHDKLCRVGCYFTADGQVMPLTQKDIDVEFRTALLALGMGEWRAWWYYTAVRAYHIFKKWKKHD